MVASCFFKLSVILNIGPSIIIKLNGALSTNPSNKLWLNTLILAVSVLLILRSNNLNSSLVRANANDTIDIMTSNTQNMTLSHDQNRMDKKITFKDCPTEITADPSGVIFIGKVGIGDKPQFTLDISGTDGIMLPSGTVAERPVREQLNGVIRYNNQYNIIGK